VELFFFVGGFGRVGILFFLTGVVLELEGVGFMWEVCAFLTKHFFFSDSDVMRSIY